MGPNRSSLERRPHRRRRVTALAAAVAAVLMAGCSQDISATSTTSTPGTAGAVGRTTATPGTAVTAGDAAAQWLLEIDATSATWDGSSVTLAGTSSNTTAFTDRPRRRAQSMATKGIVARWASMFQDDPPNVAVSGRADDGPRTWVVTATKAPTWREDGTVVMTARPVTIGASTPSSPTVGPTTGDVLRDVTVTVDGASLNVDCDMAISDGPFSAAVPSMDVDAPGWDQPITLTFFIPSDLPSLDIDAQIPGGGVYQKFGVLGTQATLPPPSTWATPTPSTNPETGTVLIEVDITSVGGESPCHARLTLTPT